MFSRKKSNQNKYKRWRALFFSLLLVFILITMTACSGKGSESANATILAPEEAYGAIEPEEAADETPAEEVPGETETGAVEGSQQEETSQEDEETTTLRQKITKALTEEMDTDDTPVANDGSRIVYLVLGTESGTASNVEKDILTSALAKVGCGVTVRYHNYDTKMQTAIFEEAITCQAKAIVCDNITGIAAEDAVQSAANQGIAVFLLHEGIDTSGVAAAQIVTDKTSEVDELAEALYTKDPAIRFVSLEGVQSDSRSIDAMRLLTRAVNKKGGLCYDSVTLSCYEETSDAIIDLLSKYPDMNMVLCYNVYQSEICLETLENAGRTDVRVVCLDGDRDEIEDLVANGRVEAVVAKPAENIAKIASEAVTSYFKNGTSTISGRRYVKGSVLTAQS